MSAGRPLGSAVVSNRHDISAGVIRLYRSRESSRAIAAALGVSRTTVYRVLREHGIQMKHGGDHMPEKPKTQKAPYRKTKGRDTKLCLKCDQPFRSGGKWNRICPNCQETNANYEGGYLDFETVDTGLARTELELAEHRQMIEGYKCRHRELDPKG